MEGIQISVRKALLVGSSFSAAPIFFALKKRGIHVSVCGKYKADPCHQYADVSYFADYSNVDELREVVDSDSFDYLIPSCNDFSYMSCASIAGEYSFPGFDNFEVASILHTKAMFRREVDRLKLPAPAYTVLRHDKLPDIEDLHFPLLVKPIDNFSGRGMTKVSKYEYLSSAVDSALKSSRAGGVVMEEFVEGNLHSHSAFIQSGQVWHDFFVDEFCSVYPYQVDCSSHPSRLDERTRGCVRSAVRKLVASLKLCDGLLHTQFISAGLNTWIIETMRRCPGDLYGNLISVSTGVDYANLFVQPFLGERLSRVAEIEEAKHYARHTITVSEPLKYFSLSQNLPARRVEIAALKCSGDELDVAPFDKLAILFAEFNDSEALRQLTPKLASFVDIHKYG